MRSRGCGECGEKSQSRFRKSNFCSCVLTWLRMGSSEGSGYYVYRKSVFEKYILPLFYLFI
jgi:hypothetical protein